MSNSKKERTLDILLLDILVLILIITRMYKINSELGLNCDEAAIQYNIYSLANYGVDRYNNPYPVYFQNRASGQSALYIYIGVVLVKMFGFSVTVCRIPQIIGGIVTLIFGYLYNRLTASKRVAFIYSILIVICPYFCMGERFAFDCTLALPLMILGLYLEELYNKSKNRAWIVCAGIVHGAMMYSYIICVIYLFIQYAYMIINSKKKMNTLIEIVATFIVGIPIIYYIGVIFGILPEIREQWITISSVSVNRVSEVGFSFVNIIELIEKLFLHDERFSFNSTRSTGTLYYISIPFFVTGVWYSIKEKNKTIANMMQVIIMYSLIANMTNYKIVMAMFPVVSLVAYGIDKITSSKKLLTWIITSIYIIMFMCFYDEYINLKECIYFDRELYKVACKINIDDNVYIDTSGTYLGDAYVMLGTKCNPKDIKYNNIGIATKINNICIDSEIRDMNKDKYYLRNHIDYEYEDNTNSNVINKLAVELECAGYSKISDTDYIIYSK